MIQLNFDSDEEENSDMNHDIAGFANFLLSGIRAIQRQRDRNPSTYALKRLNDSFEKLTKKVHKTLSDILEYAPLLEESQKNLTHEDEKNAVQQYLRDIETFNQTFIPCVIDQIPMIVESGKHVMATLEPNFEKFLQANVEYIKNIQVSTLKEGEKTCSICTCEDKKMALIKRSCDDCEGHECNEETSNICLDCLLHSFWEDTHATNNTEEKTHSKCPFCKAEYCKKDIYICKNTEDL